MTVVWDTKQFNLDMKNAIQYSLGFLDGAEKGKEKFLTKYAEKTIQGMKDYIDSMARVDPQMYHHIYEWYQVGSPEGRLYNIRKTIESNGFTLSYSFSQSQSIQTGSLEPFRNKAKIMEQGRAVTIKPKKAKALAFMIDNQEVFSTAPIVVTDPGGPLVKHSFEHAIQSFFKNYFSQSFLKSSGIYEHLANPIAFKNNFGAGKLGGKELGTKVGYTWITMGDINV